MNKRIAAPALAFVVGGLCAYSVLAFVPGAFERVARSPAAQPPLRGADAQRAATRFTSLAQIRSLASDFERTAALYDLLRATDPPALERLLDEAERLRPRRERRSVEAIVYARFAELNPVAAVERLLNQGTGDESLLTRVFHVWGEHDFEAALAHAKTLPPDKRVAAATGVLEASEDQSPQRRAAIAQEFSLQTVLARMQTNDLLESNPALAWQEALQEPRGSQRATQLRQIVAVWAQSDPEQALAATAQLQSGDLPDSLRAIVIEHWADANRDAALAWILAQPESASRAGLIAALGRAVAAREPDSALTLAHLFDGVERRAMLEAAFIAWSEADAPAALAALQQLPDPNLPIDLKLQMAAQWAHADPSAAFEWALTQDATMQNANLAVMPLQFLAGQDPEAALRMATRLSGMQKQQAIAAIATRWAQDDPRAASAWLESAAGEFAADGVGDTDWIFGSVAFSFADSAPSEAFDWATKLPPSYRSEALLGVVSHTATRSAEQASEFIRRIREPELRAQANQAVAMQLVNSDPREAVRWVDQNVDAKQRSELYRHIYQSWGFADPDGAREQLRRLRHAPERDQATLGLIAATVAIDVDSAEELFGLLRAVEAKREGALALYQALLDTAPDRAKRYRQLAGIDNGS